MNILLSVYKVFYFFSIYNFQAICFNEEGKFLYTMNKKFHNEQMYDVYEYLSKYHSKNKIVVKNLKGHGAQYRCDSNQTKDLAPKYILKNKYGEIIFDNWWGKGYGIAKINGDKEKIDFDILKDKANSKGSFQGMALNEKYAVFTLSFFHSKTKKLIKNVIYI